MADNNNQGNTIKKIVSKKIIVIALVVTVALLLLFFGAGLVLKLIENKEDSNNKENAPAAVRKYTGTAEINEDGSIVLEKSISELWNDLKKDNNALLKYLKSPEELAKLINVEMVTKFPYMGKNPEKAKLDANFFSGGVDTNNIQGIIKFKRATADSEGKSQEKYLEYKTPSELQKLIDKYNETGDAKDREEAMSYFTVEHKSGMTVSNSTLSSLNNVVFIGDSIMVGMANKLRAEGAKVVARYSMEAKFFLGEREDLNDNTKTDECKMNGTYFDWDATFSDITAPSAVYIALGVNSPGDGQVTLIERLAEKLQTQYPGVPIYISSVLPMTGNSYEDMNDKLKEKCTEKGFHYSDITNEFKDRVAELTTDGLHPNDEGQDILIANIKNNLTNSSAGTVSASREITTSYDYKAAADAVEQIISQHSGDINVDNFRTKIANEEDYVAYLQSLGGVFEKYAGKDKIINAKTRGELHEAMLYVCGLASIYGMDYGEGKADDKWRKNAGYTDAFYHQDDTSTKTNDYYIGIDAICSASDGLDYRKCMVIDCAAGVNRILQKAGLWQRGEPYSLEVTKLVNNGADIITNIEDLKVGDLIECYKGPVDTSQPCSHETFGWTGHYRDGYANGWYHVCIVGEIDYVNRTLTTYDTGHTFTNSGNFRTQTVSLDGNVVCFDENWVGIRPNYLKNLSEGGSPVSNVTSSKYVVKVAKYSETTKIRESTDRAVEGYNNKTYSMTLQEIDYEAYVDKYKMPFNYLWSLLLTTEDKQFIFDLADLVYGSEFIFTINDNVKTTTNIKINKYTYKTEYEVRNIYLNRTIWTASNNGIPVAQSPTVIGPLDGGSGVHYDPGEDETFQVKDTTINTEDTLDVSLSYVDSWIVKATREYTYEYITKHQTGHTGPTELEDEDRGTATSGDDPEHVAARLRNEQQRIAIQNALLVYVAVRSSQTTYRYSTINRSIETFEYQEESKYTNSVPVIIEKTEKYDSNNNFVSILTKNDNAKRNLKDYDTWLFLMLSDNEDTKDMVDLTKYLLLLTLGTTYDGINTFNFKDIYDPDKMTNMLGVLLGNTIQERVWIALINAGFNEYAAAGALGNIHYESGGFKTDVHQINGPAYGLCQWEGGRRTQLEAYARSKGVEPSDERTQIEYFIAELGGGGAAKDFAYVRPGGYIQEEGPGRQVTREQWVNSSSVEEGTSTFMRYFESPKRSSSEAERIRLAKDYYNQFHGKLVGTAGASTEFLAVAKRVWMIVCSNNGNNYTYGGSRVPCTGTTIDCSSFVSWVLYEYGYTDFAGGQTYTQLFKNTNWNQKYGWTEIIVGEGEDAYDKLQPGDLFVRDPGNNHGHITLVVEKKDGKIFCYDCGSSDNWKNKPNGEPTTANFMLRDGREGKIIRVTPPRNR